MSSITGLRSGKFTSINNTGEIRLGNQIDSGTVGQVILSNGPNQAAAWGTNSANLPNALTMGTNVTLASGNASFNGSVADTINAAAGATLTAGNGIDITGTSVTTDNDGTTINNTGGSGAQNQVLKVPNALTINSTTYDGSVARNFTLPTTDTIYQGSSTINIDTSTNPDTINALKVPNALTINSTTYDGSVARNFTLATTDTTYTVADPITLSAGNEIGLEIDGNTIFLDGAELAVAKVPNVMTAGSNISMVVTADGSSATTYDGSDGITINSTDTDTVYQGGTNISIDTSTTPDSINLDANIGLIQINPLTLLVFNQTGITTAIIGSAYPNKPTDVSYLNLSDSTNITSPYCFHNVYGTASTDFDSLTTSYGAGSILGALGASIVAKQTALCVEVIVYNYAISSNRDTDMRLVDKSGSEWSVGISEGGSGTGTIQTAREVHRADETDRQIVHQTWSITGLTIGSTYTFNPQARTSATSNFLAAGGNYPSAFFRGYYLPS